MTHCPTVWPCALGSSLFDSIARNRAQRRRNFVQKGKMIMQVTTERPEQAALTIDKSASVLGLHEFSLLSRIVRDCLLETRLLHTSPHIFAFLATCLLGAVVVLQGLVRLAPEVGLEPTTHRLTADCSTIELLWNPNGRPIYKSLSTPSTDDLSRSAHLESTTIWRLESRQNPHAGKGALRSAAFPGCGLAELPTPKLAPACGGPWW